MVAPVPKTSFCPGVPETCVRQDVPVQVPVRVGLSKFQFRWACPRSSSDGPSKFRGRGLVSGSCQGAVAEAGFVDEAYLVRSSWVVA
ncbi:hypothetical protein MTO96_032535 [Rhipicephalus appendiculatus]